MARFIIVIASEDGSVEAHPMKQWLREHPDQVPQGLDATGSTSHQLRNGLRRSGWSVQESEEEVQLSPPGAIAPPIATGGGEGTNGGGAAFGLEYQLRDFIAENINSIDVDGRRYQVYVDPTGRDGIEFSTDVGFIDILAVDEHGDFVVFELKRARSPDHAIGQLTRYMGWVQQTIGKGKKVSGVIVAKDIGKRLRFAVSVIPNVNLFEYEVEFRLKLADRV